LTGSILIFILVNFKKAHSAEKLATGIVKYIFFEINIQRNTSSSDVVTNFQTSQIIWKCQSDQRRLTKPPLSSKS